MKFEGSDSSIEESVAVPQAGTGASTRREHKKKGPAESKERELIPVCGQEKNGSRC